MHLTNFHFYQYKNYLYSKPVKGLRYCGISYGFAFNGKERDNETFGEGNAYDFGARIYDSRLGKWLSVDPMMQKYPSFSPYNICLNNPISNIDPDGRYVIKGATREEKRNLRAIARAAKKEAKSWTDAQWRSALATSGFNTKKEYMNMFKNGQGPTLQFSSENQLLGSGDGNGGDNSRPSTGDQMAYAKFAGTKNVITNPDGTTTDGERTSGTITIDRGVHRLLEDFKLSKKNGRGVLARPQNDNFGNFKRNETLLTFAFTSLILIHENAHAGCWITETPDYEMGEEAEKRIYGKISDHKDFGYGVFSAVMNRFYRLNVTNTTYLKAKKDFYDSKY